MTVEEMITALLAPVTGARMWWNAPPDNFDRTTPFVIAQCTGGRIYRYVENGNPVKKRHYRVTLQVWAPRMLDARARITAIENFIVNAEIESEVMTQTVGDYEAALKLHGYRQDFGFWHTIDP